MTILTFLLVATNVGLTFALVLGMRSIVALLARQKNLEDKIDELSNQISQIEIPNRYKNQNGETGILYHFDKNEKL